MEREVDHLINIARRPYEESAEPEPDHCDAAEVVARADGVLGGGRRRPEPALPGLRRSTGRPRCRCRPASSPPPWMRLLGNVFRYTPQGTAFEVAVSRRRRLRRRCGSTTPGPGIASRDRALRRGASGRGLHRARARHRPPGRGGRPGWRSTSTGPALGGTSVVMLLADADADPAARPGSCWGSSGGSSASRTSGDGAAAPAPPARTAPPDRKFP